MDEPIASEVARLRRAAWIALVVHLAAGIAMAWVLRHGLETNPSLSDRLRFLVDRRSAWTAGWLTWTAASISILYFFISISWAHQADGRTHRETLGLIILLAIAGVACDVAAQAVQIFIVPGLAHSALGEADRSREVELFLAVHRRSVVLTGYIANGFYTLSTILVAWASRHAYPRWVWGTGLLGVGTAGVCLSAAAAAGSVAGMVAANAFLVPCIVVWLAGIALRAGRG